MHNVLQNPHEYPVIRRGGAKLVAKLLHHATAYFDWGPLPLAHYLELIPNEGAAWFQGIAEPRKAARARLQEVAASIQLWRHVIVILVGAVMCFGARKRWILPIGFAYIASDLLGLCVAEQALREDHELSGFRPRLLWMVIIAVCAVIAAVIATSASAVAAIAGVVGAVLVAILSLLGGVAGVISMTVFAVATCVGTCCGNALRQCGWGRRRRDHVDDIITILLAREARALQDHPVAFLTYEDARCQRTHHRGRLGAVVAFRKLGHDSPVFVAKREKDIAAQAA